MEDKLTLHAAVRSRTRGIPTTAIKAAIEFGRYRSGRGADLYTIGWREIKLSSKNGLDLSRWMGIEVVCARDGEVITVYRNKNQRALRDRPTRQPAA